MAKKTFDDHDFEKMSFHDNFVHGMTFDPEESELLLDIDYIGKWLETEDKNNYSFDISPSTLIFHDVFNLKFDIVIQSIHAFDIAEIKRNLEPKKKGVKVDVYSYEIILNHIGEITFSSTGFNLFLRHLFTNSDLLSLTRKECNGVSFEKTTYNT